VPTRLVVASDNFVREIQTYQDCYVWLNFDNRNDFIQEVFKREKFDIFGVLTKGMSFKDENSADIIVKAFEKEKNLASLISKEKVNGCSSMFVNTNLTGDTTNIEEIINSKRWKNFYVEGLVKINGEA
jgi:hypothetical protein